MTPQPARDAFKQALLEAVRKGRSEGVEPLDVAFVLQEVATVASMPVAPGADPIESAKPEKAKSKSKAKPKPPAEAESESA